jgi:hypothetical protein
MMNPDLPGEITLKGIEDYLAARQKIVIAREGFFSALRQHMTSTQQKRNGRTGDVLFQDNARMIDDEEWVSDPARGYLTIKENPKVGRVFRISLLQMGQMMRLGVRLPKAIVATNQHALSRISSVYPDKAPVQKSLFPDDVLFDWSFDVPDLYFSALTMEVALFWVSSLFENVLYATAKIKASG